MIQWDGLHTRSNLVLVNLAKWVDKICNCFLLVVSRTWQNTMTESRHVILVKGNFLHHCKMEIHSKKLVRKVWNCIKILKPKKKNMFMKFSWTLSKNICFTKWGRLRSGYRLPISLEPEANFFSCLRQE